MMSDATTGTGGGVRCGYDDVAMFGRWTLEPVGPSLYRLTAACVAVADGLLSLPGCVVWVPRGPVCFEWTCDGPVPNDGDRVDCVLGAPRLMPRRSDDATLPAREA